MPKILLIANTDWYLYRFRLSLARHLQAHEMDVVLVSPSGQYVSSIQAEGFRWLNWEIGRQSVNPLGEIAATLNLVRLLRQEKPDLVHLHTIKPVLYGSLAARLTHTSGVIRSVTGRGYVFLGTDLRARWLRPLVKGLYRFALRSGTTLFENETDRQYFIDEKLAAPEQALLIEGVGVDTDFYQPLPEPDGPPVVLMASRMLWDKGVDTLIEAARFLKTERGTRVILVGEPDPGNPASIEVQTLRRWAEEGLIDWWGWQTDMRAVFAACHIVTLPSLGEGLPTVLLEAAACGRSIVTTDVSGCREVVRDGINGLLVPPRNPSALAKALMKLIDDPALRGKMGANGRKLAVERFDVKHISEQTLEIYRNIG